MYEIKKTIFFFFCSFMDSIFFWKFWGKKKLFEDKYHWRLEDAGYKGCPKGMMLVSEYTYIFLEFINLKRKKFRWKIWVSCGDFNWPLYVCIWMCVRVYCVSKSLFLAAFVCIPVWSFSFYFVWGEYLFVFFPPLWPWQMTFWHRLIRWCYSDRHIYTVLMCT